MSYEKLPWWFVLAIFAFGFAWGYAVGTHL